MTKHRVDQIDPNDPNSHNVDIDVDCHFEYYSRDEYNSQFVSCIAEFFDFVNGSKVPPFLRSILNSIGTFPFQFQIESLFTDQTIILSQPQR